LSSPSAHLIATSRWVFTSNFDFELDVFTNNIYEKLKFIGYYEVFQLLLPYSKSKVEL